MLKGEDFNKMVEVMDEEFKDLYEHDEDLILRQNTAQLAKEYSVHLQRGDMGKLRYRPAKKQENKE